MFKKLKPGESEDDVLRMAAEFSAERKKNPNFQPAATVVRVDKREFLYSCFVYKELIPWVDFVLSCWKIIVCSKARAK